MSQATSELIVRACPECWHTAERGKPCPTCGAPDPEYTGEIVSAKDITTALIKGTLHIGKHGLPIEQPSVKGW